MAYDATTGFSNNGLPLRPRTGSEIYGGNAARYSNNPFDINSSDPIEQQHAIEWRKNLDESQLDAAKMAGSPEAPKWQSLLNDDGTIKSQFQLTPGQVNYTADKSGLEALKNRALQTGPSAWLNMQLEKQKLDEGNQLDTARREGAGSQATAESALAMRGGLSSGARERLARGAMESGNATSQNIHNAGEGNRLGLEIQDEATKTGLLSQLPGAQLAQGAQDLGVQEYNIGQNTAAQQYNIGNALSDVLQKRAFDVNTYNQQMKNWAAGKTADAQGSGGKK